MNAHKPNIIIRSQGRARIAVREELEVIMPREPMKIGYSRVSTQDQDLALQIAALEKAGCEKLFEDRASGKLRTRQGLSEALEFLRKGDTLCVWKLDRLGRSVKNLIELSELLEARNIHLQSLTDGIDTSTPMGRFFFHIMAALAQMERELIAERTRAGLKAAKARGQELGRRRVITPEKMDTARHLLQTGKSIPEIAVTLGVSAPSVYRSFPGGARGCGERLNLAFPTSSKKKGAF